MSKSKKSPLKRVFQNRHIVSLFASQLLSNITANTILFVLINFIFEKSASAVAVGILVFLYYLPSPTIGLLSGALIDRSNRKKILVFSSLFQAAIVLLFIGIKHQPFLAYFLIFLYSSFDEFFNPTVSAILPSMVSKKELGIANTMWFFASQGSWVIASLFAGLLMKSFHNVNVIFFLASFLLLISALVAYRLPDKYTQPPKRVDHKSFVFHFNFLDFLEDIRSGYTFVQQKKIILFPILFLAAIQIAISTATIIIPSLAKSLSIPLTDAPFFLIAPTSIGTLSGGLIVSQKIKKASYRKKNLILTGIKISSLMLILITIIEGKLKYLLPFILFVLGYYFIGAIIPVQTIIQENTPHNIRGRVYSLLSTAVALASFLPSLFIVSLVDIIGVRLIIFFIGLAFLFFSFFLESSQEIIFRQL